MRVIIVYMVGICFMFSGLTSAYAGWWGKKKTEDTAVKKTEESKPAPTSAKKTDKKSEKAQQDALNARREAIQQKRKALNDTEWQIELTSTSGGAKAKKEIDIVVFKNNQVTVRGYSAKGFPTTNYTLTIQPDGTIVWETMQTSEKSGVAFWRGEITSNIQSMRGILSYHINDRTIHDFSFVALSKKDMTVSAEK